jgi:hypothetical protein
MKPSKLHPPGDPSMKGLRQGFCTSSANHSKWKSTQGKEIRSPKTCFNNMQLTNPHVNIYPIGYYEVWIRTVNLVRLKDDSAQNRSPLINATYKASLPKLDGARAACIHKPDGKCIGMLIPERFHLLRKRFHEAQKRIYKNMSSSVQCLAAKIAGLLQGNLARLNTPQASQLKESYSRILPQHISAALRLWAAMVSKEKMACALVFDESGYSSYYCESGYSSYWSEQHRDIIFGAN